ncbi:hypothetical protein VTL71DRAFT_2803 [Oculimacula yallundae]|uniref:Uncharacterized protein n=1 Tax=Oculimacula yallundae TaxID=86028 RepID=A0ABR4C9Y6_9HELO
MAAAIAAFVIPIVLTEGKKAIKEYKKKSKAKNSASYQDDTSALIPRDVTLGSSTKMSSKDSIKQDLVAQGISVSAGLAKKGFKKAFGRGKGKKGADEGTRGLVGGSNERWFEGGDDMSRQFQDQQTGDHPGFQNERFDRDRGYNGQGQHYNNNLREVGHSQDTKSKGTQLVGDARGGYGRQIHGQGWQQEGGNPQRPTANSSTNISYNCDDGQDVRGDVHYQQPNGRTGSFVSQGGSSEREQASHQNHNSSMGRQINGTIGHDKEAHDDQGISSSHGSINQDSDNRDGRKDPKDLPMRSWR